MKALQVFACTRAREHLRDRGLAPADVRVIPAAAGGPKSLALLPLDRFIFGHWLACASRGDFKAWLHDEAGRQRVRSKALAESQRLADEFSELVGSGRRIDALPLA